VAEQHFYVKQRDTRPKLRATLKDGSGAVVDVTGATVRYSMRHAATGSLKVNRQTAVLVTPTGGLVEYAWSGANGDTDTPGDYTGEFEVTFSDLTVQTFPNARHNRLVVHIEPELA
jgi:hypothetical protein